MVPMNREIGESSPMVKRMTPLKYTSRSPFTLNSLSQSGWYGRHGSRMYSLEPGAGSVVLVVVDAQSADGCLQINWSFCTSAGILESPDGTMIRTLQLRL